MVGLDYMGRDSNAEVLLLQKNKKVAPFKKKNQNARQGGFGLNST
jgi:hypothetical protein